MRVLVWDSTARFPLEHARELLGEVEATVAEAPPPWAGDDVAGLVVWGAHVGDAELDRLPGLRIVATPSVGYDHVDLEAARRRHV
jgi:lactate dehydrogenase-like 2-hydroxyacid dehydrogenase